MVHLPAVPPRKDAKDPMFRIVPFAERLRKCFTARVVMMNGPVKLTARILSHIFLSHSPAASNKLCVCQQQSNQCLESRKSRYDLRSSSKVISLVSRVYRKGGLLHDTCIVDQNIEVPEFRFDLLEQLRCRLFARDIGLDG